jgi:hypothetical protein
MNQRDFNNKIWAYKLRDGTMCADLDELGWIDVYSEVYGELADLHEIEIIGDHPNPYIDMLMENYQWIDHAKSFGIIVKRTREEAQEHNARIRLEFDEPVELEDIFYASKTFGEFQSKYHGD